MVGGPNELFALTGHVFGAVLRPLAFLAVAIFAIVLLFELLQTGIVFSAQPLKPDFSRLNPAKGLKRVFSKRMLIETAKNVLKFAVYVGDHLAGGAARELDDVAGLGRRRGGPRRGDVRRGAAAARLVRARPPCSSPRSTS